MLLLQRRRRHRFCIISLNFLPLILHKNRQKFTFLRRRLRPCPLFQRCSQTHRHRCHKCSRSCHRHRSHCRRRWPASKTNSCRGCSRKKRTILVRLRQFFRNNRPKVRTLSPTILRANSAVSPTDFEQRLLASQQLMLSDMIRYCKEMVAAARKVLLSKVIARAQPLLRGHRCSAPFHRPLYIPRKV